MVKWKDIWPGSRASRFSTGPFLWPQHLPKSQKRQHQAKQHVNSWARQGPRATRSLRPPRPERVRPAQSSGLPHCTVTPNSLPLKPGNRKGSEIPTKLPDNQQQQEKRTSCVTKTDTLINKGTHMLNSASALKSFSPCSEHLLLRNRSRQRERRTPG